MKKKSHSPKVFQRFICITAIGIFASASFISFSAQASEGGSVSGDPSSPTEYVPPVWTPVPQSYEIIIDPVNMDEIREWEATQCRGSISARLNRFKMPLQEITKRMKICDTYKGMTTYAQGRYEQDDGNTARIRDFMACVRSSFKDRPRFPHGHVDYAEYESMKPSYDSGNRRILLESFDRNLALCRAQHGM
jgi:hypothetical protein